MTTRPTWASRRVRFMNRLHARAGVFVRPATGFVSQPEPRTIGSFAKGKQLVAGNIQFAGHLVEAPGTPLWDVAPPDTAFAGVAHGFAWLDDLAAVGDGPARQRAQAWVGEWIARYGAGHGPGWEPDITGRRLIRWINHALFLLNGWEAKASEQFYVSLARQTQFLGRRWKAASPGLPRIEALTGLIYSGLALTGMERYVAPASRALSRDAAAQVDAEGGVPTRNPEELLEVFTLLTWAIDALAEAGKPVPEAISDAVSRIAPTLRTLRHSDGGLARFHGGGRGAEGLLDSALAASRVRERSADGLSMGFARLSAGRTSVIIDAAPPPRGPASYNAHASTLAFEMTSGRRPVVVNCGSGASFGTDWRRAGRATPSHSVLGLTGYSSSRLGGESWINGLRREYLTHVPTDVPVQVTQAPDGLRFEGGHNGYAATHGLTHARTLELTFDGRGLAGEDLLVPIGDAATRTFDMAMDATRLKGVPFAIRFHLHPEADASLDLGGSAVSVALKSGEIWVFRHDGVTQMTLEPSVYLETGRLKPRATKQVVLSGRAMSYATRIRWSLSKAQESLVGIRDVAQDRAEFKETT